MKVASQTSYSLKVDEKLYPIDTDISFTKYGKVLSMVSVNINSEKISESATTRAEALEKLKERVRNSSSRYRCGDCGTAFKKQLSLRMHAQLKCVLV